MVANGVDNNGARLSCCTAIFASTRRIPRRMLRGWAPHGKVRGMQHSTAGSMEGRSTETPPNDTRSLSKESFPGPLPSHRSTRLRSHDRRRSAGARRYFQEYRQVDDRRGCPHEGSLIGARAVLHLAEAPDCRTLSSTGPEELEVLDWDRAVAAKGRREGPRHSTSVLEPIPPVPVCWARISRQPEPSSLVERRWGSSWSSTPSPGRSCPRQGTMRSKSSPETSRPRRTPWSPGLKAVPLSSLASPSLHFANGSRGTSARCRPWPWLQLSVRLVCTGSADTNGNLYAVSNGQRLSRGTQETRRRGAHAGARAQGRPHRHGW